MVAQIVQVIDIPDEITPLDGVPKDNTPLSGNPKTGANENVLTWLILSSLICLGASFIRKKRHN